MQAQWKAFTEQTKDLGARETGREKAGKKALRLAGDAKTWRYVGRFMSQFAAIEGGVDRALSELFDLKTDPLLPALQQSGSKEEADVC